MITIDGVTHKATWLPGLKQTADILNGAGSGRLQGSNDMYLEYVGTFFNHEGKLHKDYNCSNEEWDMLFLTLANPVNEHTISFPFGSNQTITQKVYIAKVVRKLQFIKETNKWEEVFDVSFVAKVSAWRANSAIVGLSND